MFDNLENQPNEQNEELVFDLDLDDGEELEETQVEESETLEDADEEAAKESIETETEEESTEETTEAVALEDLEITFLGENKHLKDIPADELKAYVQKGMNQDRLQSKYNEVADQLSELKEAAKLYGFDNIADMKEAILESHFKTIAEKEGRKPEDVKREYLQTKQSRQDKMYDKFLNAFPDVKPNDVPDEVKAAVKDGADLTEAYKNYMAEVKAIEKDVTISSLQKQIDDMKKQLEIKEQNANAKKKGVVKPTSTNGSVEPESDFLKGFL